MADISTDVVARDYSDKLVSLPDFRKSQGNITMQALYYAIDKNLVDYALIGKSKVIVLTEKTLAYTPNKSPKRRKSIMQA